MFFAANITFRRRRERERKAIARIEAKREVNQNCKLYLYVYVVLNQIYVRSSEKDLRKKKQQTRRILRNVQKNQNSSTFARQRMNNKSLLPRKTLHKKCIYVTRLDWKIKRNVHRIKVFIVFSCNIIFIHRYSRNSYDNCGYRRI